MRNSIFLPESYKPLALYVICTCPVQYCLGKRLPEAVVLTMEAASTSYVALSALTPPRRYPTDLHIMSMRSSFRPEADNKDWGG
jgi:hypothetical protein